MGFLDDLKDKAGDLGGRAKDGLVAARDRAANLVDDVRDRMDRSEASDDTVEAAADHSVDSSPNSVQQAAELVEDPLGDATEEMETDTHADSDVDRM